MNYSTSFYRKIAYAGAAAALLLPISLLARPRAASVDEQERNGGVLAQMRSENNLSQASLSEVDPTSEIMKLGSLGLHGVAVNILWNQANEYQDKKAFDKVSATLDTLILLQPNFISVWEFQGHNLAYNISREFDDYEDRYFWVKEGLNFFMNGVAFNKRDHRIYDNLGLHTGLKLGKSDEHTQFREIFRHDQEYIANQLTQYGITEQDISHSVTGPDNWLWAYQWYDKSYQMVENEDVPQRTSDLMYWMKRESQLRNFADAMDDEFPPGTASQEAWRKAFEAWLIYGERQITTSFGEEIVFESLSPEEEQLKSYQKQLDELAPGVRDRLRQDKVDRLDGEFREAYNTPADQRTYKQEMMMDVVQRMIEVSNYEVALQVPADLRPQANEIDRQARLLDYRLAQTINYRNTVNYSFWRNRNEMESTTPAIEARSNFYRATELSREAKYQDFEEEVTIDGETQFVEREGAISLLRKSFAAWAEALEPFPYLRDEESAFKDELFDDLRRYQDLLRITGNEWPDDFELQPLIDDEERRHGDTNLPTSNQLQAKSLDIGLMAPLQESAADADDEGTDQQPSAESADDDQSEPQASSDDGSQ